MNRAAQTVCVHKQARSHAHARASVAALAEQPMNEATVLAQTEQTFPHVLEMRGGIRTSAPTLGAGNTHWRYAARAPANVSVSNC